MKCQDIVKKLAAYMDKELGEKYLISLEQYLETCSECRGESKSLVDQNRMLLQVKDIDSRNMIISYCIEHVATAPNILNPVSLVKFCESSLEYLCGCVNKQDSSQVCLCGKCKTI